MTKREYRERLRLSREYAKAHAVDPARAKAALAGAAEERDRLEAGLRERAMSGLSKAQVEEREALDRERNARVDEHGLRFTDKRREQARIDFESGWNECLRALLEVVRDSFKQERDEAKGHAELLAKALDQFFRSAQVEPTLRALGWAAPAAYDLDAMSEQMQPEVWRVDDPRRPLPVPVIELRPLLDRLEGWWRTFEDAPRLPNEDCYTAWREMGQFLQEHGRLRDI